MGNKSARELVLFRLIYMRIGIFPLVLLSYTREMGDSTELESFSPFFMAIVYHVLASNEKEEDEACHIAPL